MGMVGLRDVFVVAPASFNPHYHNHQHHNNNDQIGAVSATGDPNGPTALGVGVGVIPLLTATPCLAPAATQNAEDKLGLQFWQNQNTAMNFIHCGGDTPTGTVIGSGSGSVGSGSTTTCQDCGNQAKKDCNHRRCRTCCKSRGFDCNTHVKSTWVPAARRRERQQMGNSSGGAAGDVTVAIAARSSGSTSGSKKPRLVTSQQHQTTSHASTSNTNTPRSFDTTSSHQDVGFKEGLPGQVRAPAVFKCVRVTAVEDGDDEYAYQAVVKIGGRVFKGFLYDTGLETRDPSSFPNISELQLGGGGGRNSNNNNNNNGASSSTQPVFDPNAVYASGGGHGAFLGGSVYGNQIN